MKIVFYSTNTNCYDGTSFHYTAYPSHSEELALLAAQYPEHSFSVVTDTPGFFLIDLERDGSFRRSAEGVSYFLNDTAADCRHEAGGGAGSLHGAVSAAGRDAVGSAGDTAAGGGAGLGAAGSAGDTEAGSLNEAGSGAGCRPASSAPYAAADSLHEAAGGAGRGTAGSAPYAAAGGAPAADAADSLHEAGGAPASSSAAPAAGGANRRHEAAGAPAAAFAARIAALSPDLVIAASFWVTPLDWLPLQDALVAESLRARGIRTLCHSVDAAMTCFDKQRTRQFLVEHGFSAARAVYLQLALFWAERGRRGIVQTNPYKEMLLNQVSALRYPVVIKDTVGLSSFGMDVAATPREARAILLSRKTNADRLIEEYIPGEQFGVEVYGTPGNYTVMTPFIFSTTRHGITSPKQSVKLSVSGAGNEDMFRLQDLRSVVIRLAEELKLEGAAQVDLVLRAKDDADDADAAPAGWYVIEVNPRLSGLSVPTAVLAGKPVLGLLLEAAGCGTAPDQLCAGQQAGGVRNTLPAAAGEPDQLCAGLSAGAQSCPLRKADAACAGHVAQPAAGGEPDQLCAGLSAGAQSCPLRKADAACAGHVAQPAAAGEPDQLYTGQQAGGVRNTLREAAGEPDQLCAGLSASAQSCPLPEAAAACADHVIQPAAAGARAPACVLDIKLIVVSDDRLADVAALPYVYALNQTCNDEARQLRERGYCEVVIGAPSYTALLECLEDFALRFTQELEPAFVESARKLIGRVSGHLAPATV